MHSGVSLHLVESSPVMREYQQQTLQVRPGDTASPFFTAASVLPANASSSDHSLLSGFTADRVRVTWHDSLLSLPTTGPVLFVAHEFFDALPVYHFQYTADKGWCELLVDSDHSQSNPYHFRFVLSPGATPAVHAFLSGQPGVEGQRVELNGAALVVMEQLTRRVSSQGGAALIIDYGFWDRDKEKVEPFTVQAVQNHHHVHLFHEPGLSDLSALVDFRALSAVVDRCALLHGCKVHWLPLITQSSFLRNMGIAHRLTALLEGPDAEDMDDDKAEGSLSAATRLVAEDQMGGAFKVMAVIHESIGTEVAAWDERYVKKKIQEDKTIRQQAEQVQRSRNDTQFR